MREQLGGTGGLVPQRGRQLLDDVPLIPHLPQRHRAIALGQALAGFIEYERDMDILRRFDAKQRGEVGLPRRGGEQVIAADHLVDVLVGIVDDGGQVIGPSSILAAAAQDKVVHVARIGAVEGVVDGESGDVGKQAKGGLAVVGRKLGTLGRALLFGEIAAGTRVLTGNGMWGAGGLTDILAGAIALVSGQLGQGLFIGGVAIVLVDDLAVPVQTERAQVRELTLGRFLGGALLIDVLYAQHKAPPRRSGTKPRQKRRAEVAKVQITRGARRVSAGAGGREIHVHSLRAGTMAGMEKSNGAEVHFIPVRSTLYPWLVTVFVVTFLISNINATKGVQLGPLVTDGAFFLFPLAYIVGDVLSECYGFKSTRRAVYIGFAMAILAAVCFYIAIWLPAADFYEGQEAFAATLGLMPQILAASLAGYLVGQLLNAWTLTAMKKRSGEKGLFARLIASTVVGEFGDTLMFCAIAAPVIGVDTVGGFFNYVIVGFVWKTLMEAVMLPVTAAVIKWVKKREDYLPA